MKSELGQLYDAYDELVSAASLHGTQTMTDPIEILTSCFETCRKVLESEITGRRDYYEALLKLRLAQLFREYRSIGQVHLTLRGQLSGSAEELRLLSAEADRLEQECRLYVATLQRDIEQNPFLRRAIAVLAEEDRAKLQHKVKRITTGDPILRKHLLSQVDAWFDKLIT
jgi:hypothetical protein